MRTRGSSLYRHSLAWMAASLVGLSLGLAPSSTAGGEKLTLEQSVQTALENSPTVKIAEQNLRRSGAMVDEAVAMGMPKLMLNGTYQRLDESPVAEFGGNSIELGSVDSRTANLTLVQPLDVLGLIRSGRKAAKTARASFRQAFDAQVNDTTLDVKVGFFNVLRAQKFLKVHEDTVAQLEAHLRDAQAHYKAGTIPKFDVLRAETQLANARQALITAQNGVEIAKSTFNNILGRGANTPFDLIEPETPELVDLDLAACTDLACRSRPEVLQANTLVDMYDKVVKIRKLQGRPSVDFRWSYNRNFDTSTFNPREGSWVAYLTTTISVYDGGANRATVEQARCDANTARATRQQVTDGVTLDAKQSYLSLKESEERIRAAETGLEQGRESMRLAQVRYKGGVSTQVEVFDAQAALTLAETNHVNALYDYQTALARVEHAVGGETQFAKLLNGEHPAQEIAAKETGHQG